jgi:HK97 gp10 family phage protein
MRLFLEGVAAAGEEQAKHFAGGHARIEDSVQHRTVKGLQGWEGTVFLGGKWGFIARFREFGTQHQSPRPFLRPGVEKVVRAVGGSFRSRSRRSSA